MAKQVGKISRKPGNLYYVDGQGNVMETAMKRGGKKTGASGKAKTGMGKVSSSKRSAKPRAKKKTKHIRVSKKSAMTSCGTRLKKGHIFGNDGNAYKVVSVK